MRRSLLVIGVLLLVVPSVLLSAPRLLDDLRLAAALRTEPWPERRSIIFGPYYAALADVNRSIPGNDAVALVPRRPEDRDVAMFTVYQFFPRTARVYPNLAAVTDGESPQPRWAVVIDQSATPMMTLLHQADGQWREVARH
jgi:hypothetical protein